MTDVAEESPGEVLCRVMVENPHLICAECERIAAAIIRDRQMRFSVVGRAVRKPVASCLGQEAIPSPVPATTPSSGDC